MFLDVAAKEAARYRADLPSGKGFHGFPFVPARGRGDDGRRFTTSVAERPLAVCESRRRPAGGRARVVVFADGVDSVQSRAPRAGQRLRRVGPAAGVVAEEEAFEEGFEGVVLVVVEGAGGFEGVAEVVVGAAFVVVEEERVCAGGERERTNPRSGCCVTHTDVSFWWGLAGPGWREWTKRQAPDTRCSRSDPRPRRRPARRSRA